MIRRRAPEFGHIDGRNSPYLRHNPPSCKDLPQVLNNHIPVVAGVRAVRRPMDVFLR